MPQQRINRTILAIIQSLRAILYTYTVQQRQPHITRRQYSYTARAFTFENAEWIINATLVANAWTTRFPNRIYITILHTLARTLKNTHSSEIKLTFA